MAASVPDPLALEDFRASLVTRHPLTQRAYLGTLRDFLAWLATQPGDSPFASSRSLRRQCRAISMH
jgi:hypothetical protein